MIRNKVTRNIRKFVAMALPIVVFALMPGAVMAQSYTGNWPATVSQSHHSNGTYCLTLTDDGSLGWPHSGGVLMDIKNDPLATVLYGTFQLIDGILMVSISNPGGTGELGALLFFPRANGGQVGKGVYEDFYGSEMDSGVVVFGVKNSCSNDE